MRTLEASCPYRWDGNSKQDFAQLDTFSSDSHLYKKESSVIQNGAVLPNCKLIPTSLLFTSGGISITSAGFSAAVETCTSCVDADKNSDKFGVVVIQLKQMWSN